MKQIVKKSRHARSRQMSGRSDGVLIVLAAFLITAGIGLTGTAEPGRPDAAAGTDSERPNVVVIVSDDQAYTDFGFMGNERVRTPHLDRLAERSAVYTSGYLPSSVCRPALASLMTGLYPHRHGIHFNHPPPGFGALRRLPVDKRLEKRRRARYLIRRVPTLPRKLRDAGYRSFQSGKHWEGHYRNAGFTDGMTLGKPAPIEKELGLVTGHGTGDRGLRIGRRTMEPLHEFINRSYEADDPFFVWYAPMLPHTPHNAPEALIKRYRNADGVPDHYVRYYAAITWFDRTVGDLLEHLNETGVREDTIVAFVCDNGWVPRKNSRDRYTKDSKRSPFEMGVRTPLLINWPGHTEPGRHEAPVSGIDLAPTLLRAAGVEPPGRMGGENLLPSARGKATLPADRPVFGEIYPGDAHSLGAPSKHVAYRWVRRGDWKLIVPHLRGGNVYHNYLREPALYNVSDRPRRRRNRIEQHPSLAKELRERLDRWWTPGDDAHLPAPPEVGENK